MKKPTRYSVLSQILSPESLVDFIRHYGGQRIYVTLTAANLQVGSPPPPHLPPIIDLLGSEQATKLCETFGGDYMYIPLETSRTRNDRRAAKCRMAELHRQGNTVVDIAAAVGVSRRTIFRWLNEPARDL
jgi:hypothetical protein